MTKQTTLFFAITLMIVSIISGCSLKQSQKSKQAQDDNQKQGQENISTSSMKEDETLSTTTTETITEDDDIEPEIITSNIDTSNWKTYRSEEYEFKVKYPGDLIVEEYKKGEPSNDPIFGYFSVFFKNKNKEVVFFIYIDKDYRFEDITGNGFVLDEVIFNGEKIDIYNNNVSRKIKYYRRNNVLYSINLNSSIEGYKNVFYEVVSNFSFSTAKKNKIEPEIITSNIDTSNWKTYRSEAMGFEAKYPSGWNIADGNLRAKPNKAVQFFKNETTEGSLIGVYSDGMDGTEIDIKNVLKFFDSASYKRGFYNQARKIIVNDENGFIVPLAGGKELSLFLHNGSLFKVFFYPSGEIDKSVYDTFLLNFKILE